MAVSHRCVPKSMVCTSEKLWFGFAPPTMKTFPFSASPTGGKYEQLWPTRGQGLSPGQVRVYHAAFLGLSPGSKMGSCFMVPYAEERKGSVQASSHSTTDPTMPFLTGLWRSSVVEHLPGMRKVEALKPGRRKKKKKKKQIFEFARTIFKGLTNRKSTLPHF